jgi:hypothetical protein
VSLQQLTEQHRDVNGVQFTPRWGAVTTISPNHAKVLFADCLQDEFADSFTYMFESTALEMAVSYPVALPDNFMTWIAIVENTGNNQNARAASLGVICASENGSQQQSTNVNLDASTKSTIDNAVRNIIQVGPNGQITNFNQIINIRQSLVQNAIQIVNVTGNNNTVNAVINQTATQIASQNASSAQQVDEIVNATAAEQGVQLPPPPTTTGGGGGGTNATTQGPEAPPPSSTGGGAPPAGNDTTNLTQSQTNQQDQEQPPAAAPPQQQQDDEAPVIIVPPPAAAPPAPPADEEPSTEEEDTTDGGGGGGGEDGGNGGDGDNTEGGGGDGEETDGDADNADTEGEETTTTRTGTAL